MKQIFFFCLFLFCILPAAKADHITGGEMYYTYTGTANGLNNYRVTLKLFMRCSSGRQFNNPAVISIFNRKTTVRITDINAALSNIETIRITNPDPCITNPPAVCYEVGYYNFSISLPPTADGYVLASQVNFRINTITNFTQGYRNVGALYTTEIPGTAPVVKADQNTSAKFVGSDLVIVCANNRFSYSFAATDDDGDQLRYSFCNAFQSTSSGGGGTNSAPPGPPPYQSVPYGSGFDGSGPLGAKVQVNAATGLITGIAPPTGIYVVTVCVDEIRNGVVIATQRKDLQINIAPCDVAAAVLQSEYQLCKDTRSITLSNLSNSPLIKTQNWELLNAQGQSLFTSASPTISYTFADTGLYTIKLVINRNQPCTDSTTSIARVYPGFIPAFTSTGVCFAKPTNFFDATTTVYGVVNSWNWDFGEFSATNDTSNKKDVTYTYPSMGTKNARLIVTNSKGCRDTTITPVNIVDKPPLTLAFHDTLICVRDAVQLKASGNGNFSWSPNVNITNANTPDPTVAPLTTTKYFVDLDDNGCLNKDTVLVRVTDRVNLQAMNDTTICSTDTIQLRVASNGFQYAWTPASQLINPAVRNPLAVTNTTTTYEVTARIGGCTAKDQVVVTTVPYPLVNAGADTVVCFNTPAQLNGTTNADAFRWSPAISLTNANSLNPVAKPAGSTVYVLSAFDNEGCPKSSRDTIVVTVLPDINAFAGRDTAVIINQPLQLAATGGMKYLWTPAIGLSANNIANPVALYNTGSNGIQYKVLVYNEAACVDSAYLTVKVFNTGPSIFIPTAFTPNSDGKNDILKPIMVGMKKLEYFSVYNRWGQRIYTTSTAGQGWNGTIGGLQQASGTFVWMVKAIDFNDKPYIEKGTVTLIR